MSDNYLNKYSIKQIYKSKTFENNEVGSLSGYVKLITGNTIGQYFKITLVPKAGSNIVFEINDGHLNLISTYGIQPISNQGALTDCGLFEHEHDDTHTYGVYGITFDNQPHMYIQASNSLNNTYHDFEAYDDDDTLSPTKLPFLYEGTKFKSNYHSTEPVIGEAPYHGSTIAMDAQTFQMPGNIKSYYNYFIPTDDGDFS